MFSFPNEGGYYDENGDWVRTKFCFVYCGPDRCTCEPPGGIYKIDRKVRLSDHATEEEAAERGHYLNCGKSNLEEKLEKLEALLAEVHDYFAKRNLGEPAQQLLKKLDAMLAAPATSKTESALHNEASDKENEWKRILVDALVVSHIYKKEHEHDPRKALSDLIAWETDVALDPRVSKDAQALIDRGRREAQHNSALVEALKFYANPENYDDAGAPGNYVGTLDGDRWEEDEGRIAREALQSTEQGGGV